MIQVILSKNCLYVLYYVMPKLIDKIDPLYQADLARLMRDASGNPSDPAKR